MQPSNAHGWSTVEAGVETNLPPLTSGTTLRQKVFRNGEIEWVERAGDGSTKRWRVDRNGQRYNDASGKSGAK